MNMQELLSLAWEAGNSVVYLDITPLNIDIPTTFPLNITQYNQYKKEKKKN